MQPQLLLALAALTASAAAVPADAQRAQPSASGSMRRVAPALADYTDRVLFGDMWRRKALSPRDRSLVTVSALIATGKTSQLPTHLAFALDNGVTPSEIGATITQLAFYSGWPSAASAVEIADTVFRERGVPASALQPLRTPRASLPPSDPERASRVERTVAPISPSLAQLTNDVLFEDLWRRQDLRPRDRSLVTIVALAAGGDADQLAFHLRRGLENGLTLPVLGETMAHLAFYVGWPKAVSGTSALGRLGQDKAG